MNELIKHVNAAIDLEKDGIKRYQELVEKSQNEFTRSLFFRLIDEEKTHVIFFENLLSSVEEQELEMLFENIDSKDIFEDKNKTDEDITNNYIGKHCGLIFSQCFC